MRTYSKPNIDAARQLRHNATDAERKLWSHLRRKQMGGLRFRRQHPLGPYIADFFCYPARLIVELDGTQHREDRTAAYDLARTRWFEAQGYKVLRFENGQFLREPNLVLQSIWQAIDESGAIVSKTLPWEGRRAQCVGEDVES